MCGICGILNLDNKPVDVETINKMCEVLKHRGPDNKGVYIKNNIAFGHQRLSIIDLSERANQPLSNNTKTIWIVYNGEVYNFREIREELKARGYIFRTSSDTEVILYAYEEWREECVTKFNGMFALAIWDEVQKKLFLARDRLGKKPLFYYYDDKKFIFGSEIKAILCDRRVERKVNLRALSDYLSLGYILAPHSIIEGIKKLKPGHYLLLTGTKLSIREYWHLAEKINEAREEHDESYYIENIKELLYKSVERRLISDVPLGAFLSGGIDSSAIVAFMVDILKKPVKTFSIGFQERSYSELKYARFSAQFLGSDHYDTIVYPDIKKILPEIIWFNDEPFADTSLIPMYFLAKVAREKVKVVLTGDGGDENFAGYETYIADFLARFYSKFAGPLHIPLRVVSEILPVTDYKVSFDYKIKQFLSGAKYDSEKSHYWWRVIFSDSEKLNLLNKELYNEIKDYDPCSIFREYYREIQSPDFLNRNLYVDIKTWLVDDILMKVDRATMAHALEARVPYLDHKFVEFVAMMPGRFKLRFFKKKYILKKMLSTRLPKTILSRKKSGFNAPISLWIRGELKNFVEQNLLCQSAETEFFNKNYAEQLLREHYLRKKDNGLKIFALLNYVLWSKYVLKR